MLSFSSVEAEELGNELVTYELDEYTVRTWHFEDDILDVPADVIHLDRDAVDRSLATSVPELLETEANLFFSDVSGSTEVSLRGFGEGSGLRSLILIDGQVLNPPDMGRINWEQIPIDAIESIELLRGGHNVLYGDKALSGVIKIETRRSVEERLEFEGSLGSFATAQTSLSGSLAANSIGLSGGVFCEESEGYRENSQSKVRSSHLHLSRKFLSGDELDLRLSYGEIDLTYPGGLDFDTFRSDPRVSGNLGDEGSDNRYATVTGRAQGQRSWGSWETLAGFDYNDTDWSFGAGSCGGNVQNGFNLKPRLRFENDALTLIVGTDFLYDSLDFTAFLDETRTLVLSEAKLSEHRNSIYFFAERDWNKRLSISGGLRYEWIRYQAEDTVLRPAIETNRGIRVNSDFKSPADASFSETIREGGFSAEFSINFRITEELSFWAGYDRAYRYPVFDERAAYQGFPLAESVAQDLEAEEGNQFEAGLKWRREGHEFFLTTYLLQMENEIIFDPSVGLDDPTTPGNGLNRNVGAVDRYGADLNYSYKSENWGLSLALAFVGTEMQENINGEGEGNEVPLVPALVSTNQIWWSPMDSIRLRLVHRFIDERFQGGDFANDQLGISSYHLFDAQADCRVSPNARVFVKLDNIFDELYAKSAFFGSYYPGAGRSIQAGIQLSF